MVCDLIFDFILLYLQAQDFLIRDFIFFNFACHLERSRRAGHNRGRAKVEGPTHAQGKDRNRSQITQLRRSISLSCGGPRFSSVLQIWQRLKSSRALEHSHLSIPDSVASLHRVSFLNRRSSHHGCRKRPYHHEGGSDVAEFGN